MKYLLLKSLFIISLFVGASIFTVQSQSIAYDYDQAGNRISRVIKLPNKAKKHVETTDSTVVKDQLGKQTITVYPNPTRGALGVDIKGSDVTDQTSITVYNGQGVQLYFTKADAGLNSIDMSAYPVGWYILRVQIGSYKKEYKIIKE